MGRESRLSKRFNKKFKVRLGRDSYVGYDISKKGFSIVSMNENYDIFINAEFPMAKIYMQNGGCYDVYGIKVLNIRSGKSEGEVIYGFEFEKTASLISVKHYFLSSPFFNYLLSFFISVKGGFGLVRE